MPFLLLLTALGMATAAPSTMQRIQPDIVCLDPDMEFPVACDDGED
jgi:hypothetical protein